MVDAPNQQPGHSADDPHEIAAYLVQENGLDRARQLAMEGTFAANEQGDFYRLSVWRDVRRLLNDWTDIPEEPLVG
ncbi:MAG: hypothetical protein HOM58_02885 [Rhodospirillaceae bacterium]|jgi:hypothetical protein|nr:hypothetical protein [Rhodospirillaceae bacterium]MBT5455233.1 hypothetical protein [Rhodospirillaceae bacterium]